MAITNKDRIGKGLDCLVQGLQPFIERELKNQRGPTGLSTALAEQKTRDKYAGNLNDVQTLLSLMIGNWPTVFTKTLGKAERSYISEIQDWRNKWAHNEPISYADADRALDTMERLLSAVSAGEQVEAINQIRMDLKRVIFDEQRRTKDRQQASLFPTEGKPLAGLKPWREVIDPHPDVAAGKFQQAEFAADLWQVYEERGSEEYRNPTEFFRRTFLTQGLRDLLSNAILRLTQKGGDPVVELQTNFGGGKTHSMLALYHLFSGAKAADLPGVDELIKEQGLPTPPKANRSVFVGTMISPGRIAKKKDGCQVRTLWGEIAWQLGGKKAYELVREDDEKATNPGLALAELFRQYSPCLILIDEWVAYARQLHQESDLPGGSFDTQFTFAQTLTEAAKAAPGTLVVLSIPASESGPQRPGRGVTDIEVGGEKGLDALRRLKNAIGRVQTPWRPASPDEGFEIVRRRLFEPMTNAKMVERDRIARAFIEHYKEHSSDFPPEVREAEYERRIKMAYPIHPELFDRLFEDWSTSEKFQRTRGVLRLMATVIHTLWKNNDSSLLILPGMVPLDASEVQTEVTRYLEEQWVPIMEKDIDGAHSLPMAIDKSNITQGRYSATRRVARTIFLGSAPTLRMERKGIDDRRVKLGSVQPGEAPASFGDAIRKLSEAATYLYVDQSRYWYSTQPTVKRLADDRAASISRDQVLEEIRTLLREEVRSKGDFARIHVCPLAADVPDETEARLVILDPESAHSPKDPESAARQEAKNIFSTRGNGPRNYRNALVFLGADANRLKEWEQSIRKFLAWSSIWQDKDQLNLDAFQIKQVETQKKQEEESIHSRMGETYIWLIVPGQDSPQSELAWTELKLSTDRQLAVKATKKLVQESALIKDYADTLLRRDLDSIPLWKDNHISLKQLADYFAQYPYLPRFTDSTVLMEAIARGVAKTDWNPTTFAYAMAFDEKAGQYHGLVGGERTRPLIDGKAVLVKPEIAAKLLSEKEKAQTELGGVTGTGGRPATGSRSEPSPFNGQKGVPPLPPSQPTLPPSKRRFFGSVEIPAANPSLAMSKIVEEVIKHFTKDRDCKVALRLEIEAEHAEGFSDHVQRIVGENARTLRFEQEGFEG